MVVHRHVDRSVFLVLASLRRRRLVRNCRFLLAAPSEVLVSQTVQGLVSGSGLVFEDAGEHELKGVPDLWQLYRVLR